MRAPLVLLALIACGGHAPSPRGTPSSNNAEYVYQDELRRSSSGDLLTALQHLRPGWFRRSPSLLSGATPGALLVYLDGVLLGGSGTLRQISVASVLAAHYLSPPEAEAAFGPGALYGAISVSTVSH